MLYLENKCCIRHDRLAAHMSDVCFAALYFFKCEASLLKRHKQSVLVSATLEYLFKSNRAVTKKRAVSRCVCIERAASQCVCLERFGVLF